MEEYKIIHYNLFNPCQSLFKSSANEKAQIQLISCCNSDNCGLYKKGECSYRKTLPAWRCPYGAHTVKEGFSQRARRFSDWIRTQNQKYKGIKFLKYPSTLAVVGDYIYLPYNFIDMYKNIKWLGLFVEKENFTVENIIGLVNFRPQAVFGGTIRDYQAKVIPKFLKHLSEVMPDLFSQVMEKSEYAKEIFKEFSNIGRKAILETITPNIGKLNDIHGGSWTWNGEKLTSENSKTAFTLVKKIKKVIIIPQEGEIIKITDEKQVNKNTKFID